MLPAFFFNKRATEMSVSVAHVFTPQPAAYTNSTSFRLQCQTINVPAMVEPLFFSLWLQPNRSAHGTQRTLSEYNETFIQKRDVSSSVKQHTK